MRLSRGLIDGPVDGVVRTVNLARPYPPEELAAEDPVEQAQARPAFEPSAALLAWAQATFLDPASPIYNPDHEHLNQDGNAARILWLWTNVESRRRGRSLIGQAQLLQHGQSRWDKARATVEARRWWDEVAPGTDPHEDAPDFTITLYAPWCAAASDAEFMALCEHELLHCSQRVNGYGFPCFSQETGRPIWAVRGHDVECFVSEVIRYGTVSPDIVALVEASKKPPLVSSVNIAAACGTCMAA